MKYSLDIQGAIGTFHHLYTPILADYHIYFGINILSVVKLLHLENPLQATIIIFVNINYDYQAVIKLDKIKCLWNYISPSTIIYSRQTTTVFILCISQSQELPLVAYRNKFYVIRYFGTSLSALKFRNNFVSQQ